MRKDMRLEVGITEEQLNKRLYDSDVEGRRYRGRSNVKLLDIVKKKLDLGDITQVM